MYYNESTYDNFNTVFGTVTVGGKFDNRICRLCDPHFKNIYIAVYRRRRTTGNTLGGPQVYKCPLAYGEALKD